MYEETIKIKDYFTEPEISYIIKRITEAKCSDNIFYSRVASLMADRANLSVQSLEEYQTFFHNACISLKQFFGSYFEDNI